MKAAAHRPAPGPVEPSRRFSWPVWLGVFAVALALRLWHVWLVRRTPLFDLLLGDARGYDAWALAIAGGDWLGSGVFFQAPLYPYFMGAIYALAGHQPLVVRLVQIVLGSAACVLLGVAGTRVFGRAAGVLAALLLAVWPSAVFADALIQRSALDTLLFCAALALLPLGARPAGAGRWLGIGALIGLLALTREQALWFVPVLAIALLRGRAPGWERSVAAFLLGTALVIAPVALRNQVVGGEVHLGSAGFGPSFYIGNNPRATGLYRPLRHAHADPRTDATQIADHAVGRALSPREVSRYWTGHGVEFITAQPGAWLTLLGRKAALLLNRVEIGDAEDQYLYAEASQPLGLLTPWLHFGVLVPCAAAGLVLAWRRRGAGVLIALVLVYGLGAIATFVTARSRLPLLPLLSLFAAALPFELRWHIRARGWPRLALATVAAVAAGAVASSAVVTEKQVRAVTIYNIARALEDQRGGLATATEYYRRAVALDPGFALAFNDLGIAWQRQGQLDEAVVNLARASGLQPYVAEYHFNLGAVWAARGDAASAESSYRRALELDPANADAHNNLGTLAFGRGDLSEATAQYNAALAIDPRHVQAMTNLGAIQAQQGDADRGIATLRAALAIDPDSINTRENLALALLNSGRGADAAKEYEVLLRDTATPRRVLYEARLAMARGQRDQAIAVLEQALHAAPADADARALLDSLRPPPP